MLDTKALGSRIRELRKKKGITQNKLAEDLNICFQAVSNWERGIAPPEIDNLLRLASYFNVLVDDLLRPAPQALVLGIDGGGTKTAFAITTMDGHILKQFSRSGSNANDIGFEKAFEIVADGIRDSLIEFPSIGYVGCGLSGITAGNHRKRLLDRLAQKYPSLKINIQSDSANLFAMDDRADMAIISGTGSVVFVKKNDQYLRLGGWGQLFDSAGSAYDIGRDAVTVTLGEEDAMEPHSLLGKLLIKKLGTPTAWDAISMLYKEGKPFIASLADIVFEAYKQGDARAIEIIDRNAKRLGELLNMGITKHYARPRVIASGGMFEHYADVLMPHLASYTDATVLICDLPPIYGACRQARKLFDDQIPEDFHENFKASSKGTIK